MPRDRSSRQGKLPWFRGRKSGRRRIAAARLDIEGESSFAVLGRASNRIAVVLLVLVLAGLAVWGVRSTDWDGLLKPQPEGIPEAGRPAYPLSAEVPLPEVREIPLFEPKGDPGVVAKLGLALNAAKIGAHEEARILLEEARQEDPALVGWHYISGLAAWARRDTAAARAAFQASIARGEAVAMAAARLGDIAIASSDVQEAATRYSQVVELYPGDPWMRLKLSLALRRAGDPASGVEHIRMAARLRPYDANFQAWALLAEWDLAGRPAELPARPSGLPALWHLATAAAAAHRGEIDQAAKALRAFSAEAEPAMKELAAVEPLVLQLAAHEALRPLLPVIPMPREP